MAPAPMGNPALQGVLSMRLKDKEALYGAYMPFVRGGGLFVPTQKKYRLGDDIFVLLSIMGESDRLPVAGKVVWITPNGAQGNRVAGIGVQFSNSAESEAVRTRIETELAGMLGADTPTRTM